MNVVAYVPDLMDRSRVAAAVDGIAFVSGVAQLAGAAAGADVVLVDLGRPGVLDAIAGLGGVRVVAFCRHDASDTIRAGRDAGAEVLIRSDFFADVAGHLS